MLTVKSPFAISRSFCAGLSALALSASISTHAASQDTSGRQQISRSIAARTDACIVTEVGRSSDRALLTRVNDLAVDSRGRVYVGRENSVVVLANDGNLLGIIGGAGEGPGEFRSIANVQVLQGDTLLVYDEGLGRITIFDLSGSRVVGMVSLVANSNLPIPDWVVQVDGGYVTASRPYFTVSSNPNKDYKQKWSVNILDDAGAIRRHRVLRLRAPQDYIVTRLEFRGQQSIATMPNPFGHPGELAVGPAGAIYYGFGDSLAISIYSKAGERIGGFALSYDTPPITDDDVAAIFDSDSGQGAAKLIGPSVLTFVQDYAENRWPAFKNFIVDESGRIWVGLIPGEISQSGQRAEPARKTTGK